MIFINWFKKLLQSPQAPQEEYHFHSNHSVVRDFSEFSGIPIDEIEARIQQFRRLTKKEWDALPVSKYGERARQFYGSSKCYIYDLLSVNCNKEAITDKLNSFDPLILESIKSHPGKLFLEFGGGLGIFCEIVSQLGKTVTYLDIPGQVFDFAVWRFKKYNIPINVVCSDPDNLKLDENFDIVFSDAVLEHVANPEKITEILCQHINKEGLFILLVDLAGFTKEMPMHRNVDINGVHNIIKNNGFTNISGEGTFCSIWKKR